MRAEIEFTVVKNFHSPETRSEYLAGLTYTVRHATQELVLKWENEGKITIERTSPGKVKGYGTVK